MISGAELVVERNPAGPDLEAAYAIRQQVFVREQGIPADLDRDGCDDQALHVLIRLGENPAATGRVLIAADGLATAARIAVLPAFRGRGLGRRVVEELEEMALAAGATRMLLKPHDYLEGFYRQLGFATVGGVEHVAGYRLITMAKKLPAPDDQKR